MGDETKATEIEKGNTDPLRAPKKPSTAEAVEKTPSPVAEMPTQEEMDRREEERAPGMNAVGERGSVEGKDTSDEERAEIRGEVARRKRGES